MSFVLSSGTNYGNDTWEVPTNSDKLIGKVYLSESRGVYIELDKSLTPRELSEIQYIEARVAAANLRNT